MLNKHAATLRASFEKDLRELLGVAPHAWKQGLSHGL
jgi:hypothetical protein